jgi:hypothetical protein
MDDKQSISLGESMRSVCEKLFAKHLKANPMRPNTYIQTGQTMVMIESRQWKLAYSPLEKVTFDISDENAILIEVPGDHGVHLVPWHMILRITVTEGGHH